MLYAIMAPPVHLSCSVPHVCTIHLITWRSVSSGGTAVHLLGFLPSTIRWRLDIFGNLCGELANSAYSQGIYSLIICIMHKLSLLFYPCETLKHNKTKNELN
ncbi:UNVERIFIED_CONTAM: hypothetical protein K2H54_020572 [Gekko kuhli]